MSEIAVDCKQLTRRYGPRAAVDGLDLQVKGGEIFSILGPNGSGKTTLFRVLSTLLSPSGGSCEIFGRDVVRQRDAVRRQIGVVFQSPSLDLQLTAEENLRHHGHLYGLRGDALDNKIDEMLSEVNMNDRRSERVATFSGGMRRRVELAKGMLTSPKLLILDEPSTGLDPTARIDLWAYLFRARIEGGVTILLTTHLMDEADRCDRLAIMDHGKLLACDTPSNLKERIGGDVITLTTNDPQRVRDYLRLPEDQIRQFDRTLRFERPRGHEYVPQLIEALPGAIESISVGRPTLEDVFIDLTGHEFHREIQ
ncbi:MAG: ATP-binding cassette domain-containing protein [Phycisphaerae bacterium]|nr:ATP-binding cassette domain-containing protein [Phycisphaerae bacterium]